MSKSVKRGLALAVLVAGCGPALAANPNTVTLQDRQQAACYSDVQKLCGQFVPDVAKTEACMMDKRPLVSKKCSDMWDVAQ